MNQIPGIHVEATEDFARMFKRPYDYKMGGSQTLVFPNGQSFYFNDCKYYQGRRSRVYNANIRHDLKGTIHLHEDEVSAMWQRLVEDRQCKAAAAREREERERRIKEAAEQGIYLTYVKNGTTYIMLSDAEVYGGYFDAKRLARTLSIPEEDAELLRSVGKTYVITRNAQGQTLMLYHSNLEVNYLSISVEVMNEEEKQRFESNWEEWSNAPYAYLLGQTDNRNHFVC